MGAPQALCCLQLRELRNRAPEVLGTAGPGSARCCPQQGGVCRSHGRWFGLRSCVQLRKSPWRLEGSAMAALGELGSRTVQAQ